MIERRKESRKGLFIVVDGLDGIGKGEVERALRGYEEKLGKAVYDCISHSRANRKGLPELIDFWNPPITYFDTVMNAEPSYTGIGQTIREEIISKNGRDYTAEEKMQAYALDRKVNMQRIVIPAIINGVNVIQSRSVATSLTYQQLEALDEGKDREDSIKKILSYEGNALQLVWAPDLLIIPTINNIEQLIARLEERARNRKNDNSIFENVEFQKRLKPLYESDWLRKLFEDRGTIVEYLDASISEQETRQQAVDIYKKFLARRNSDKYMFTGVANTT